MNISVQLKKSAAFVLLFLFLATLSEAQNYSVMNSGSSAFFRSEIQTSLIPFGPYNGYFTWSRIKESFIDSIASSANETNCMVHPGWGIKLLKEIMEPPCCLMKPEIPF